MNETGAELEVWKLIGRHCWSLIQVFLDLSRRSRLFLASRRHMCRDEEQQHQGSLEWCKALCTSQSPCTWAKVGKDTLLVRAWKLPGQRGKPQTKEVVRERSGDVAPALMPYATKKKTTNSLAD